MRARTTRLSLAAALLTSLLIAPAAAVAAPPDIGVEGPSYAGGGANPTGEKPESKTWFNDGSWWASLWDTADARFEIFRLNAAATQWTSTDVALDDRINTRADTLWDGSKLYVASHVFSESSGASQSRLYRFRYNASTDTYALDAGWPEQINNVRSESLVIDKDSTGQLWATWVQGASGSREVWVNRTTIGDSTWGTPFKPVNNTLVANDDISSLVAFGDNKIGVFWSNQRGASFHFAVHDDTAADTVWGASVFVYQGSGNADDHINLKSLQSDGSGRVFAVIKTSRTGTNPSIVLLVRSSGGGWSAHTIWTGANGLTRPIVLLDTSNNRIHAFASKESGGPVYTKTSSLSQSAIGFPTGLGTIVMYDDSHDDINDPTSSKQNVTSATGLLVLASNQATKRYWHHFDSLGGGGGNSAPVAVADSYSTAHNTPLSVPAPGVLSNDSDADNDTLTAIEVSDSDNNVTLNANGGFTYTPPAGFSGTDTFTYRANDGTADSNLATVTITVGSAGGGGGLADTYVNESIPGTNFGTASVLHVRRGLAATDGIRQISYLRFTDFAGGNARLRLFVTTSGGFGGAYDVADDGWSETGMTWTTRPSLGAVRDPAGALVAGWVEYDLGVLAPGTHSIAVANGTATTAKFSSREGANDPQLVVVGGP